MNEFPIIVYIGAFVISVFIGFLTGIFGVGGGFLITPALMILLKVPGNIAVGTGLIMIFVNSSFAMLKRRGSRTIDFKLGLVIAAFSTIGIVIGLRFMEKLKDTPDIIILGKEQNPVSYILYCMFLVLLLGVCVLMTMDYLRNNTSEIVARPLFDRFKVRPYMNFATLQTNQSSIVPIVVFAIAVGFITAMLGVGGGFILLPALIYLIGQHPTKAAGTSLLIVWVASIIAGAGHLCNGNIELLLLGCMLFGGVIGTNFGTVAGLKMHGAKIKKYFIFIIVFATMMVAVKLYQLTFGINLN